MVVNGVSTRKVTNITEELCGVSFSKSTVSCVRVLMLGSEPLTNVVLMGLNFPLSWLMRCLLNAAMMIVLYQGLLLLFLVLETMDAVKFLVFKLAIQKATPHGKKLFGCLKPVV